MSHGYEITINGETHNQTEWCRIFDVDPSTVRSRMERTGMSFEQAVQIPKAFVRRKRKPPERVGVKEPVRLAVGYRAKSDKRCRRCYYSEKAEGRYICTYILFEHHRRPCPAGDECTVRKPKTKRLTDAQRELFKAGLDFGRK